MNSLLRLVLPGTAVFMLAFVAGCYERAAIPARATPATAKIALHFEFPEAEQQRIFEMGKRMAAESRTDDLDTDESFQAEFREVVGQVTSSQTDVVALLTRELPQKGIGHVVRDSAGADLRLNGITRVTGMNMFVTDWQLIDPNSDVIVRAGSADWGAFPNPAAIADQILTDLVAVNLAHYGPAAPAPPTPTPSPAAPAPTAPGTARSATDGENAWAVVIGVEKYREGLVPALYADNDAVAFAQTLETTLNVPASHIKVLRGDRAARADIASVIEEWLPRNARSNGGRVYVYFSGHGAPDVESGDAYLVPFDADPAYLKTRGYSIKQLYASLARLKNQQTFVFLDACFSGSGDRSVIAEGTRPLVPVKTPKTTAGIVSYAAAQPAQSTGGDNARQHGLFTAHVLDAINGTADSNADGNVDIAELQRYVDARVEKDARLSNREQQPVLSVPPGQSASSFVLVQGLTK